MCYCTRNCSSVLMLYGLLCNPDRLCSKRSHWIAALVCVVSGVLESSRMLMWQVRVVVERLARRLGYDEVAAAIPEEHRKLLTHIRKQKTRKIKLDKAEQARCSFHPRFGIIGHCTVCRQMLICFVLLTAVTHVMYKFFGNLVPFIKITSMRDLQLRYRG